MNTENKTFNEGEVLTVVDEANRRLQTVMLDTPLPMSFSNIVSEQIMAAYQMGRRHEKREQEIINDATITVGERDAEQQANALIAGIMFGEGRTSLRLNLEAVRRVFTAHTLVTRSIGDDWIDYELVPLTTIDESTTLKINGG